MDNKIISKFIIFIIGVIMLFCVYRFIKTKMKVLNNKKKKPTFIETKEDVIQIYKELTRRKCYRMDIAENESPEILDSKLLGVPYLPIGEEYPVDKQGKPLSLVIQINFENVNLDNYPSEGVLQVYVDAEKFKNFQITDSDFVIRYYEDTTLEYQKEFPVTESITFYGFDKTVKLNLKENYTWMPISNCNFETVLENTLSIYNEKMNTNIPLYEDGEISEKIFDIFWNEEEKIPSLLLSGYSNYVKGATSDGSECESHKKECLIKLVDNNYSKTCLNIIISKEDLLNRNFEKAKVFYMW